ncbi:MAG: type II secretion system F family protein [Lachnospiraceae bacterium]|nr:type II secretion system F family protein [Lachnospiraceae bacterium]
MGSYICVMIVVACITSSLLTYTLLASDDVQRIVNACVEFGGMLRKKSHGTGVYSALEEWIRKNGGSYHYGMKCTPGRLFTVSVIMGTLGIAAGVNAGPVYGLMTGAALMVMPYAVLPVLNRRDNERMLPDLHTVYRALALQIRAGVYVTDALAESYTNVTNMRLRDAFISLAGDIVMKADIYSSLDRFQRRFDNRQIDSLCITVTQALESGQAVDLLGDISEQIRDMETSVMNRRKGRLERNLTFYQLGMLGAVLAVALYACVGYMLDAARSL